MTGRLRDQLLKQLPEIVPLAGVYPGTGDLIRAEVPGACAGSEPDLSGGAVAVHDVLLPIDELDGEDVAREIGLDVRVDVGERQLQLLQFVGGELVELGFVHAGTIAEFRGGASGQ